VTTGVFYGPELKPTFEVKTTNRCWYNNKWAELLVEVTLVDVTLFSKTYDTDHFTQISAMEDAMDRVAVRLGNLLGMEKE